MIITTQFLAEKMSDAGELVATRYNGFFENPDDIETNHKLRVSIRTARSLVAFLKPWQTPTQNKLVQGNLKTVVKATSKLRELDVFMSMAEELDPASPELVSFCCAQAATERQKVLKTLDDKRMRKRLKAAVDELRDFAWKDSLLETGLDPALVRMRFDAIVEGLNADLDALDESDYETMHSIRKRAKQVRYVAEQFSELIGEDAKGIAKEMKSRQDALGALCDAKVNREMIGWYLIGDELPDSLTREIARLL